MLEIACRFCGVYNRLDKLFCVRCRYRLIPLTVYDISLDDFVYSGDRDNLKALEGSKILEGLAKRLIAGRREQMLREWLHDRAYKVEISSELHNIVRTCGWILGVERLPEVYVAELPEVNAFTFGEDYNPVLVIGNKALEALTREELTTVIAHELTHVKSQHMTYHTLAELLVRGANFIAPILGVGVITTGLQMLLLAWHRESEITADRGALLVVQNPETFKTLMLKLAGRKAEEMRENGLIRALEELCKTHPDYGRRIEKVNEFYNSPEYSKAVKKIKKRIELNEALVPLCRYCRSPKDVDALFCPACRRSQI